MELQTHTDTVFCGPEVGIPANSGIDHLVIEHGSMLQVQHLLLSVSASLDQEVGHSG